jgi:hypothetical protein
MDVFGGFGREEISTERTTGHSITYPAAGGGEST